MQLCYLATRSLCGAHDFPELVLRLWLLIDRISLQISRRDGLLLRTAESISWRSATLLGAKPCGVVRNGTSRLYGSVRSGTAEDEWFLSLALLIV